jgi:four helix bundle protein
MAPLGHRELKVWQFGVALVRETYRLTKHFPASENFGLVQQARRAAVSVPANIAEGHGRIHRGEFFRHVAIARGSLMELDTHFVIAREQGYLTAEELARTTERIAHLGRMLTTLARNLRPFPAP